MQSLSKYKATRTPKKGPSKKASRKKASPKKASHKKASPKKGSRKKKGSPKKASHKKASPKKASHKKASPKKGSRKKASPKENIDIYSVIGKASEATWGDLLDALSPIGDFDKTDPKKRWNAIHDKNLALEIMWGALMDAGKKYDTMEDETANLSFVAMFLTSYGNIKNRKNKDVILSIEKSNPKALVKEENKPLTNPIHYGSSLLLHVYLCIVFQFIDVYLSEKQKHNFTKKYIDVSKSDDTIYKTLLVLYDILSQHVK